MDLATTNHASEPGDAPTWPFEKKDSSTAEDKTPCDHDWELEKPKKLDTADEKKARLRKTGILGDAFEADAAVHNKIKNGDDLSGTNKASKIYAKCKKCGKKTEIDHVTRDENGYLDSIVECKSGNSGIKGKQAIERIDIAKKLGCKAKYKIQAGDGADKAEKFLTGKGWDPSNIIKI